MSTLEVVVIAVAAVLLLLALGGAATLRRRRDAGAADFRAETERANRDLAAAHAADNGWEPERVGEAARAAFAQARPQARIHGLELVQVIDPPGTQDDRAVYRVNTDDGGAHRLTLARADGDWVLESLE